MISDGAASKAGLATAVGKVGCEDVVLGDSAVDMRHVTFGDMQVMSITSTSAEDMGPLTSSPPMMGNTTTEAENETYFPMNFVAKSRKHTTEYMNMTDSGSVQQDATSTSDSAGGRKGQAFAPTLTTIMASLEISDNPYDNEADQCEDTDPQQVDSQKRASQLGALASMREVPQVTGTHSFDVVGGPAMDVQESTQDIARRHTQEQPQEEENWLARLIRVATNMACCQGQRSEQVSKLEQLMLSEAQSARRPVNLAEAQRRSAPACSKAVP